MFIISSTFFFILFLLPTYSHPLPQPPKLRPFFALAPSFIFFFFFFGPKMVVQGLYFLEPLQKLCLRGDWWNKNIEEIESKANHMGVAPIVSNSHTINGMPGPLFSCTEKAHNLTVIKVDVVYAKPFTIEAIFIAPGQTTNVLVKANQVAGKYTVNTRTFMDVPSIPIDKKIATAFLLYKGIQSIARPSLPPLLPSGDNSNFVLKYTNKLKSLNSLRYPARVLVNVDWNLFYTISLGHNPCPTCLNRIRLAAALNNITFVMPRTSLLESYYFGIEGVYTSDFPDKPPTTFNYTVVPSGKVKLVTLEGTRLSKIAFNSSVELVLQDTSLLTPESHPFHLHGYNFFVVETGIGNFNPKKDPANYNLKDPIERNTVGVPTGGWTAIRFRADNPGIWFFHCHLEVHTSWGLEMAFVVEDGPAGEGQGILPLPNDLPKC